MSDMTPKQRRLVVYAFTAVVIVAVAFGISTGKTQDELKAEAVEQSLNSCIEGHRAFDRQQGITGFYDNVAICKGVLARDEELSVYN